MSRNDELFERLLVIVPKGRENAVPQVYLASLLGVTPQRLKALLLQARTEGYFVAGDTEGYYIPNTLHELHSYYRYMYDGAMTRLNSLKRLRETLKSFGVNPEKDFPLDADESERVPYKNVALKRPKKNKFRQTCFILFPEDQYEYFEEDQEE